ncbi:VCBS repeat-containing protein, partial [bacterium]|nr:VCBS repeat-containing protein [bacterium]
MRRPVGAQHAAPLQKKVAINMKYAILILLLPSLLLAQEFEFRQEFDTIPITVDGYQLPAGWTGGYNEAAPSLVDLDGDNDFDLIMGHAGWGQMAYFKNDGNCYVPSFVIDTTGLFGIQDIGTTHPTFWDIDSDGDFDLFLSTYTDPIIAVYKNISTSSIPLFQLEVDTLRNSAGGFIYCEKSDLADLDNDGDQDLMCGEFGGFMDYYENIGDSNEYSFFFSETHFGGIDVGTGAAPTFYDIDNDGDYDLFIGNQNGNIWFYRNQGSPQVYDFVLESNQWLSIDAGDDAIPDFCDIDGDGDFDLFVGKDNDYDITPPGDMQFWRNIGTPQNYNFVQENEMYLTFDAGHDINL